MSIRTRLTLWYTSVLGATLVLFSVVVYFILLYTLLKGVDQPLEETANKIVAQSRAFPGQLTRLEIPPLDMFQSPGVGFIQIWTPQGELVQKAGIVTEPLDKGALNTQKPVTHDVIVRGVHLRVLTVPLQIEDTQQLVGYLQIASSDLRTIDQARRDLLAILVSGIILALVFSAIVGAMLARRALRPIDAIIETALNISRADDLERRILYTGPPDEVGRLTAAFNEMLERLERLFRAQQRFLADVSHELRTPLTTIRGNVDLLRRLGGADAESLDAIQSEAERMTRLVGDLILLAKAEGGGLPIAYEPVELDTLLLQVYRQARVLGNGLEIKMGEEDQVTVLGDTDKLKQLLLNLVDNAVKYTPKGGQITLGLVRDNGWARLTVADTGIGIPPEDLPHIFDRFYRVDKARSRAAGGAGLGLSIAQWIAQAHGGHITVSSEVGRGTTFSVWLPVASNGEGLARSPEPAVLSAENARQ